MKGLWKYFVLAAIPSIRIGAETFRNQDADDIGKDDIIARVLDAIADVLDAIARGKQVKPSTIDALEAAAREA